MVSRMSCFQFVMCQGNCANFGDKAVRLRWFSYIIAMTLVTVANLNHAPARSETPLKPVIKIGLPRTTSCPAAHETVDIKASADPNVRRRQRDILKAALAKDGTTVRLGPDVDLDFSDLPADFFPISFGRCVTLTSVSAFNDVVFPSANGAGGSNPAPTLERTRPGETLTATEARTPKSLGPVLRYGKHRDGSKTFLEVRCYPDQAVNDGARISGFRLFGPDFGNQSTDEVGIRLVRCVDIEISNMEIAGWASAGIAIEDDPGPDHSPDTNGPGGRIMNPDQIRIYANFLHHNQHPSAGGHAEGYGVKVSHGAWARNSRNVFDFNRHAIAAEGDAGGYAAEQNLVLKGGGYHGSFLEHYTHIFDAHGTGCWCSSDLCGDAGIQFWYLANAFQYRNGHAIKIRGKPAISAFISENIFTHPGLEGGTTACVPFGDDAINLDTQENVEIGPGNVINFDSFGKYGVCDFDGDGVDDLFLATGSTWWFSSFGEFHWAYLNAKMERLDQVRLGYFDDDLRCDVLAEQNGQWVISSGGTGDWRPLGDFGAHLSDVVFGRFDPNERDHRPNVTRRTTHAFRRAPDGQWFVTPLSSPNWQPVQSSGFPMSQLRFGDFTGDGVTDVLAVENGHWAISESARGPWRRLNATLGDPVGDLFIANMDADDNIDDILRLERKFEPIGGGTGAMRPMRATLTWWRSKNGVEPWQRWKEHVFEYTQTQDFVTPGVAFAGRFGAAPGGGTLVIDPSRFGQFYSKAEIAVGASPDWKSLFPY